MELDADKLLVDALRDGIREGVKAKLQQSYDNPLNKLLGQVLERHAPAFQAMLGEAIASCVGDAAFRAQIAEAVRHTLAKTLVQRFGGELEKQVNQLKSDPATRARITLAITEIVKERAAAIA